MKMIHERLENIHPGEILREEFLEPCGINACQLAREINIPRNRICLILKGKRRISTDTALRLGTFFGNSAQFWLGLQEAYDLEETQEKISGELKCIRCISPQYEEIRSRIS